MRKAAVTLVAVILLAGCGTGLEAVGTTPTPTPTRPVVAPGIDETGITSPSALLSAHIDSLRNRSYTARTTTTVRYENGSIHSRRVSVLRVGKEGERFHSEWHVRNTSDRVRRVNPPRSVYFDGNRTYVRTAFREGAAYRRYSYDAGRPLGVYDHFEVIGEYVTVPGNGEVTRVEDDGWIAYRVEVDGERGVSLRFVVGSFGLIREFRVRLPAGRTVFGFSTEGTVTYAVRYERIGETRVDRPGWVSEAINHTGRGSIGRPRGQAGQATRHPRGESFNRSTPSPVTTTRSSIRTPNRPSK